MSAALTSLGLTPDLVRSMVAAYVPHETVRQFKTTPKQRATAANWYAANRARALANYRKYYAANRAEIIRKKIEKRRAA